MTEKKTDPAAKKYPGKIKHPDSAMYHSQKKWEQRLSKMKTTKSQPTESLPSKKKVTVGSTYGLTKTQILAAQAKKMREAK